MAFREQGYALLSRGWSVHQRIISSHQFWIDIDVPFVMIMFRRQGLKIPV